METKKILSLTMTQFPREDWQMNMCLDTETLGFLFMRMKDKPCFLPRAQGKHTNLSKFSEIKKVRELSVTDQHFGWISGSRRNFPRDPAEEEGLQLGTTGEVQSCTRFLGWEAMPLSHSVWTCKDQAWVT